MRASTAAAIIAFTAGMTFTHAAPTAMNGLNTLNANDGAQKREADPQGRRGPGRIIGNVAEGLAGTVGAAVDVATIGTLLAPAQKREAEPVSNEDFNNIVDDIVKRQEVDEFGQPQVVSDGGPVNLNHLG
ncbi:hypothetical protein CC80DRAFT_502060 [Byssothecium circinans]|uniref:Uncharacterized protein n=1 Tax=Byssothecium circinans TaxID=147558 RepID=A0A6A5U454_9PLEO|nr:hypothetical protein CC80DRAFT_502060 [Byssothecium circinans]